MGAEAALQSVPARPRATAGLGLAGPVLPAGRPSLRRAARRTGGTGPGLGARRAGAGCAARATLEDAQSSSPRQAAGEALRLPLDYYKLLQVPAVASRDSVTTAFDRLLHTPPALGYSQATLLARGTTLKGILHTLTDVAARKAYDERLRFGNVAEDVPDEFVPGMLALLQESGESQTVVAAGEQWLSMHRRDAGAKDVALTTALAHTSVANACLERSGDVLSAVRMLEVASQLLATYRVPAEHLQRQVAARTEELQPALACELVALPLERFQERERGLALAKSLLSGAGAGSAARAAGMAKQKFLERLGKALTAEEMVQLYEAAGTSFAETPSELYDVAVAYITSATASQSPARLARALQALQAAVAAVPGGLETSDGLKQAAERRTQEEGSRRAVAAAVCHLLLGETEAAHVALGLVLGAGEAGVKCERSVLAFIKSHSPSREDLLPGLCFLAQRWVADVAQSSFRGSAPGGFTLEAWFQEPKVQRYLELRDKGMLPDGAESSPLRVVAAAAAALATPLLSGLSALLAPLGLLADGKQRSGAVAAEAPEASAEAPCVTQVATSQDMSAVDFREARKQRPLPPRSAARPPAGVAAPAAQPAPVVQLERAAPVAAAAVPAPAAVRSGPPAAAEPSTLERRVGRGEASPAQPGPAGRSFDADDEFLAQALSDLRPLPGIEERMWDSQQARIRWDRVAALAAILGGAAFLAGRALLGAAPAPEPAAAPAAAAAPSVAKAGAAAAAALSRTEAEALIQRWQQVKSDALGPSHALGRLGSVLSGELLSQWQERAEAVRARGWHYSHTLESSKVEAVTAEPGGGARVRVVLSEAVRAHRGSEGEPQAFRSQYTVDYELARQGGAWVIVGAEVQQ